MTNNNDFSLDANTDEELRDYNLPLYGTQGQFSLTPGVTVPYFSTLMSIKRTTSELKTHEEVAPSLDNRYTLEELFQRQIDPERVRSEIVEGYLKAHNKMKFFNSITVALFPKDSKGSIIPEFENYPNNDPSIPVEAAGQFDNGFASDSCEKIIFGGVQLVKAKAANLARLRWDKERVDAVAVDGQHRLHALKQWFNDKKQELTDVEKPTRISVIFLLLHPDAGFERSASDNAGGIKGIAREIFTDLNKNAKEVDMATQIILDDRSLESRCVRSLITASTCEDSDTLLPLSLLRWREANNRFDQKYFLNSLVNLHLIVQDLLNLQLPDPMNPKQVRSYIENLQSCLGTKKQGKWALSVDDQSLLDYYNTDYFDAGSDDEDSPIRPFIGIPPVFLPAAVEGFKNRYAPWVLSVLRDFAPYRELIKYARNENLIEGQFSQFQSQPESARVELQNYLKSEHGDQWHDKIIGHHERAIQKIKATGDTTLGEQWAFKTIFQKAFLRLAKQIALSLTDEEKGRIGTCDDLIEFMTELYKKDILRVLYPLKGKSHLFWTFIALNYGNRKIRVSAQTEKRIEEFLRIAYIGTRIAKHNEVKISQEAGEGLVTPRSLLQDMSTNEAQLKWTTQESAKSIQGLMAENATIISPTLGEQEAAGTIEGSDLDKEQKKIARERIIAMLSECWIEADESEASSSDGSDANNADHDDGMI